MSRPCLTFRDRLVAALGGAASEPSAALRTLSWHEHLLACADCRALLEAEEALEDLLATLPQPQLPPGVAARVLARLAHEREAVALDRLLDAYAPAPAPAGLAGKVLAGLEGERAEVALDRLLDRLPAPVAPVGLAGRVLARLEAERTPQPARPGHRRTASPFVTVLRLAAALALLVGGALGLRALLGRPADTTEEVSTSRDALASAELPPSELLESLDLLESWDLITDESIDVALTSLDTVDEVLLEIDRGKDPLEVPAEEPSNG